MLTCHLSHLIGCKNSNREIRSIRPQDRLTGLSLGDDAFAPLKTFAQRHAHAYERRHLARTYAAFNLAGEGKLLGYVTLVCGEVLLEDQARPSDGDTVDYRYPHYPAVKIARLAVDRRVRSLGIGEALVNLSLGIARDFISPNVGCRFLIVDAKTASVRFYERRGFTMLDTLANRQRAEPVMFVDLNKL